MSVEPWKNLQMAYADAMWTWASVETQVFVIYLAAIGALNLDIRPIRAAFFSINSFEMRLTTTNAAVKERWGKVPRWIALLERCKKASGQRGRIAHREGRVFWPEKPHQKPLVVLCEPFWHHASPQNWGTAKSTGVDEDMLLQFKTEWHRLNYDLAEFGKDLWQQELQPTSPLATDSARSSKSKNSLRRRPESTSTLAAAQTISSVTIINDGPLLTLLSEGALIAHLPSQPSKLCQHNI